MSLYDTQLGLVRGPSSLGSILYLRVVWYRDRNFARCDDPVHAGAHQADADRLRPYDLITQLSARATSYEFVVLPVLPSQSQERAATGMSDADEQRAVVSADGAASMAPHFCCLVSGLH